MGTVSIMAGILANAEARKEETAKKVRQARAACPFRGIETPGRGAAPFFKTEAAALVSGWAYEANPDYKDPGA